MPNDLQATAAPQRRAEGAQERTLDGTISASVPRAAAGATAPVVPGYELVRELGRGGMGVVWEAIDQRLERRVALKVHLDPVGGDGPTMFAEAKLAAKVSDPGVVAVHDLGSTLDGHPYYTMDLVEGTDLRALLRDGPLPQPKALALGAEIARAVAAAHERGIVHRDLKPGNILIDAEGRPRILDFGLALHAHDGRGQSQGVAADHFANAVFGTPAYMSPEQVAADAVGAAADVHAIGILLYEMLTGARPFTGETQDALMKAIATQAPERPTAKNPSIHVDVERVVLRCLEKKPDARWPTARKLAAALSALVEGRPVDPMLGTTMSTTRRSVVPTPTLTAAHARESASVHHRWSWTLAASPRDLWPLVSNTERLNRAIGLPEVEFSDLSDKGGDWIRKAKTRVLGMELAWREMPFEWVKDREHSVFRQYDKGPLEALWNRVQLTATPSGGTELVHEIWLVPRSIVGRVAASWEVGQKTGKNLDRVYRQLDENLRTPRPGGAAAATSRRAHLRDAFEPLHDPSGEQERHVTEGGQKLVVRGFDQAMVDRFTDHLLYQPTKLLEKIRPYELADEWGMDRAHTLDMLLHAANVGMVDLAWDLLCPRCMAPHESFAELSRVPRVGACAPCQKSYERDLRESVQLVFRPHPAVRQAPLTTYCAGSPALRPHVLCQQVLSPGELRKVSVDLPRGDYRLVASRVAQPFLFSVSGAGFVPKAEVVLEHDVVEARPGVLRAGEVEFTLSNATPHEQIVRVEHTEARQDGVTAADVLTLSDFQDMFSDEILAEGEHMSVSRLSFLFVELEDRAGMLKRLGDAGAWAILQKLDGLLAAELHAHRGVRIPASLDLHVATFGTSASALAAAIGLLRATDGLGAPLRAAIHEGQCIALTRGGRTEYFGKTLHRGACLLGEAPPHGIALSMAVAGERRAAEVLHTSEAVQEVTSATSGPYEGTRIMHVTLPPPRTSECSSRHPSAQARSGP